jgi:gas vesicle protein GvpL/GvpF
MIHVYGVVDELDELPPVTGLDEAPLELRHIAGLDLVVSQEQEPSGEVSREAVLRHAAVVEELMNASAAVLPAQLGRAFRDEAELEQSVREQAPRLTRALQDVRGCVEFGLRAIPDERSEQVESDSGAEYMRTRLEQVHRQDRLVARLHEPLARLARAHTLRRHDGELNAAYLVPAEQLSDFRGAVARIESLPDVTVVCTGPWPPYSFAEGAR